jgi:hypothetical protein
MTMLVLAGLLFSLGLSPAVGPPKQEKELPYAYILFRSSDTLKEWTSLLTMTTVSKARYEVRLNYGPKRDFDADTFHVLLAANWLAEVDFEPVSIRLYGVRAPAGEVEAIESIVLVNHLVDGVGEMPVLYSIGGVKVETKKDDGKARRAPAGKPLPNGPVFRDQTYVELDFSTLPIVTPRVDWNVTFNFYAPDRSGYTGPHFSILGTPLDSSNPHVSASDVWNSLCSAGYKAELIGLTKVRVYGHVVRGRYYPALRGEVESEDLKPEELPKVKNAGS